MISGRLSANRQRTLRNMFLVPVALLAFIAIAIVVRIQHPSRRDPWPAFVFMGSIPAMMLYFMAQNRKRAVSQFEYDGATLRYETLSRSRSEAFSKDELREIQPLRSRSGQRGYVLVFRTGAQLNIDFEVEHSRDLIKQLRQDRWPEQSTTL